MVDRLTPERPTPLTPAQREIVFRDSWTRAFARSSVEVLRSYRQRDDVVGELAQAELERRKQEAQ